VVSRAAVRTPTTVIAPACYDVQISHQRHDPLSYGFSQRSSLWLVDLDRLPSLPRGLRWLAGFRSVDHLGVPGRPIRTNLEALLAEHGVARPSRILMLANPQVLGYVFNPLSVFYCYDLAGCLSHLVAEVRNTYGGRHSYLLQPDELGRAGTDKAFYVSPFYPVDGRYTMRLPQPGPELLVTVTLHRDGERPFAAVVTGRRRDGARPSTLWTALRSPLATRAVMFGIKRHGIRLYLKGLRPCPRNGETVAHTSANESAAQ
jgi:DUF1365 family protein